MSTRHGEARVALGQRHCRPSLTDDALSDSQIAALLLELPQWQVEQSLLLRTFVFADYWETIAFVNASAWVSHQQDHHPDLVVGFNRCRVEYTTHSAGGLSENDFICAARLDALLPR